MMYTYPASVGAFAEQMRVLCSAPVVDQCNSILGPRLRSITPALVKLASTTQIHLLLRMQNSNSFTHEGSSSNNIRLNLFSRFGPSC